MKKIFIFLIPILLILFFWKNTILHITTHLYDWQDVPFIIWQIQNNIKHIGLFDLIYHTETNAMFPFPLSLSFTDHFYFPSMIAYLFSLFTSNVILQFNVLAIFNHLLIYISSYLLTGRFTKNQWIKVIVSFYIAFGPYFFTQLGHFQMIFFWPLLLSLYFLLHPNRQLHQLAASGVFLGWQFMTTPYLGFMSLAVVGLYYVIRLAFPSLFPEEKLSKKEIVKNKKEFIYSFYSLIDEKTIRNRARTLLEALVVFVAFVIVSEPTIEAYIQMQQMYKPVVEQGQFVTYAAHITDYLFPSGQNSLFYQMMGWWKRINKHTFGEMAAFIGLIPLLVSSYWLLVRKKIIQNKGVFVWLAVSTVIAFICSLGPRMNWNGKYLVTPLPYWIVLKYAPFVGFMRALARWYLVISLAISIFFIFALEFLETKFKNKSLKRYLYPIIFALMIIEFYPTPLPVTKENWLPKSYGAVQQICKDDPSGLLEYPFDYRAKETNVTKDLHYKTNILLASTAHNCDILSGFSSYRPPKYDEYRNFLQDKEFNRGGLKLLTDLGFRYVKFNLYAMTESERKHIEMFSKLKYVKRVYTDTDTIIVQLHPLSKAELIEPLVK